MYRVHEGGRPGWGGSSGAEASVSSTEQGANDEDALHQSTGQILHLPMRPGMR